MTARTAELAVRSAVAGTPHLDVTTLGRSALLADLHEGDDERREAEQNLRVRTRQLSGLLRNIRFAVLVEDENRRVAVANQALADMFESPLAPDAMVGADCSDVAQSVKALFADPEAFVTGIDQRVAQRVPVTGEELLLADGRVLERDYIPVLDGEDVRSHIWLYRDVTDRKLVEEQQRRTLEAERLARRNVEASQAQLEEQNRSLLELDRLKTELVATVSHELRTPLTSIVSFGDLLGDPDAGDLNDIQAGFVDTIQRNAHRLIGLVDDLLLLARLESQNVHLDLDDVDLAAIVTRVAASHSPAAAAKSIAIDADVPDSAHCRADASRIEQLLDNLLSNAVKFTSDGGLVTVRLSAADDGYQLTVSDTGIGIPEGEVEKLFERFFRASNARAAMISGTGLGLAVCNAIARLHGGTVSVDSIEGSGTTFTVTLPKTSVEEGNG